MIASPRHPSEGWDPNGPGARLGLGLDASLRRHDDGGKE